MHYAAVVAGVPRAADASRVVGGRLLPFWTLRRLGDFHRTLACRPWRVEPIQNKRRVYAGERRIAFENIGHVPKSAAAGIRLNHNGYNGCLSVVLAPNARLGGFVDRDVVSHHVA